MVLGRKVIDVDMSERRFSKPNTPAQQYERDTWPELERLATESPEAGIHFQSQNDIGLLCMGFERLR